MLVSRIHTHFYVFMLVYLCIFMSFDISFLCQNAETHHTHHTRRTSSTSSQCLFFRTTRSTWSILDYKSCIFGTTTTATTTKYGSLLFVDAARFTPDFGSQPSVSYSANYARDIYTGDLDGDGDIDIAAVSSGDDRVRWFRNEDADGSFVEQDIIDIHGGM
jgi:hypothetical protein